MSFSDELKSAIKAHNEGRTPSIQKMGINYAQYMTSKYIRKLLGKETKANSKDYKQKMEICKNCSDGVEEEDGKIRCKYCGCNMGEKNKYVYSICKHPNGSKFMLDDLVSIIIPVYNEPYIEKTIDSLFETAIGQIEVIVVIDGTKEKIKKREGVKIVRLKKNMGERYVVNKGVKKASGKYLFRVDAHCKMDTIGWDLKLKEVCEEKTIVTCRLLALNKKAWKNDVNHYYGFVYMSTDFEEKWNNGDMKIIPCSKDVYEQMCFTGCGWMIRKDYYWELGGHDEALYRFGRIGPEWCLKTWLTGGKILYRDDIWLGHSFTEADENGEYPPDPVHGPNVIKVSQDLWHKWVLQYQPNQIHGIEWLIGKFEPTGWEKSHISVALTPVGITIQRTIKVEQKSD